MLPADHPHQLALRELRAFGLSYPEAHTKTPWPEHLDLAVRDKTFVFLCIDGKPLSLTCKLGPDAMAALGLPFATPTGYGLARSGWVTANFTEDLEPPVAILKRWIDTSYRLIAPKRLSKTVPPFEG
jgi:predicted DNA-binding protein (MmcQ/YjbR family)